MTDNENWRPVAGYEGLYAVSDRCRVKSLARVVVHRNGHPQTVRERILAAAPRASKPFFLQVALSRGGVTRRFYAHVLARQAGFSANVVV
ncbi:MAG: NUMOD4 domain-containing protein [Mycobacterium sp.]|uniref:NUMOD4 domain-containing protein n=1 Tax=Mycobacterium sp. TaxID=1785 RepID=UPI003F9A7D7C